MEKLRNAEQILTIAEIAAYLETSVASVYRMIKRGELRAFRVGGRWRVKRSALEQLTEREASPR